MAETRYEIGVLNYHCSTYESAIDFLNNFNKHKSGQPICVFYGSEDTEWRVLFAVGSSETDGTKYNILGEVDADDINEKIQWFSFDDEGNIKTDGNTLRLVHDLTGDDDLNGLMSNNENVLFVGEGGGIGCIYHNGTLFSSPYIEDKILKEDLTIGETTYEAGSTLTSIIQDILEKINPGNVRVDWDNIENKPAQVEDAFDCDSFMKKDENLSDLANKREATQNLLSGLDGIANNTVLKFENGVIKWGSTIIGWYDEDGNLKPGSGVKFVNISREEYNQLTTPPETTLYFVHNGSGTAEEYELYIGGHSLRTNSYHIAEAGETPEDVKKRYALTDSEGSVCGDYIDIPKDKFISHAELRTVTEPDVPYEGANVGDEYIDLEIMNCAEHIYIPLGDIDAPQADWNEGNSDSGAFIKNKPTKLSEFINDGNGDSPSNPFITADVLSKSIICNTSVPSLDISDMVVPKDAKTITVESTSRRIMTNIFNGDGSYQRNGNNPGLNIPSRRMVEYNGYIYWVGGENNINIYRTPTTGTQSKTIWKTLDSTKFTSTFSIVWISGYLVVAGNASHLAFISLSTGEITYTQLNETDTKYYWVGLDAVDQNTWAISTGWGNYNTLAVMTSDGLKQITPLKIHGFKFIDDVLWITHQGGFGIGTYNFGLSKLDLNDLESGFVNVLDFGTNSNYANTYTIGKFPINFFIEDMRNALYIVSHSGYLQISKDGGDTWNVYKLSTYGTYPVTKLMTRSDGRAYYCYEPSNYSCALREITGLNGDTFTTTQVWSVGATQNYVFPVPVQNGISFNYLYKEYMGQNRYTDTALYYYDFDYYSKYKSILDQNGSYSSNKYIIIENLITSGYTYYTVLCKVISAYSSAFSLELYSGPNEILIIVDSPTWPRNNGNVGFYSAKKNQYAGVEWSFDLYNGEAEAISERTLLATDEEIDEICQ